MKLTIKRLKQLVREEIDRATLQEQEKVTVNGYTSFKQVGRKYLLGVDTSEGPMEIPFIEINDMKPVSAIAVKDHLQKKLNKFVDLNSVKSAKFTGNTNQIEVQNVNVARDITARYKDGKSIVK